MTADQCFQKMLSNLNPTEKQRASIQITRNTIDQVLRNDPKIRLFPFQQPSFFTGSYSRHTIIRPLDDIDLYVRVHYAEHAEGKSPKRILVLMARALRRRYVQTKIDVDSPCIAIRFRDFKFEVVPVVAYQDNDELYNIPGPGCKSWVQCYPHVPNKWLSSSNHYNNEKFIPLIKILKQWNRANKLGLKSFHLELLTAMVFNNVSGIISYPQGVYEWMYSVSQWIHSGDYPFVLEPGKSYTYVDQYLYDNRVRLRVVRKKLEIGLRKAEVAYEEWLKGKEMRAKGLWRQMFGDMFPAPTPPTTQGCPVPPKSFLGPTIPLDPPFPPSRSSLLERLLQSSEMGRLTPPIELPNLKAKALIDILSGYKDHYRK